MHTKGPWKLDLRSGALAIYPADQEHKCFSGISESFIHFKSGHPIRGTDGEIICWEMDEQDIANARLIAAAPELFELIVRATSNKHDYLNPISDEWQEAADQLIRKATGA